ncbi:MAG: mannan endo-1,4-beta-mannosidase [Saprospiraceae bacterium]|nr:MAG: mannan endo-1,4-beta-mannosidase [Saprospiraceae bacterium]
MRHKNLITLQTLTMSLLMVCLFIVPYPILYAQDGPIDINATKATKALYSNLKNLSKKHILFGQQDALAYGVMWKDWHKSRSDVADVCGKQPAVYGWDLSKLGKSPFNIDTVAFDQMQNWIKEAFKMGGINTISWHFDNFINGKSAWDIEGNVVASILPGGENHEAYKAKLDLFVGFVKKLRVGFIFQKEIPIIFRPFHEHTGAWFWWGQPHCTPEEYKALWQFTVSYLRDVKGLHNLLYCYSPDIFEDKAHYLECYPGDEWVDILGLDDYHDLSENGTSDDLVKRLRLLVELANEKGKVAALTETGQEGITENTWWTQRLLNPIKNDPVASGIAWILVWRNSRVSHHFGPYPGHTCAPDFIEFSKDPMMLFENQLPKMYRINK